MAGEATVRVTRSVQFGSITVGGVVETINPGKIDTFQETFGVVADQAINLPVDVSAVSVVAIVADKDCTLETNSTSTPTDTFALKANKPLIWSDDDPGANPLTADVTVFYLTAPTASTTLKIGIGSDASS